MRQLECDLDNVAGRYALVAAPFYADIVERLVAGARQALEAHGVDSDQITLVHVPGAFEIPQACRWLDRSGAFDAIIPLGCVIRGETPHFDYVCDQAANGVRQLAMETDTAVVFGVLTCDSGEQARARAGEGKTNKGHEAARAAVEMVALKRQLQTGKH